ncbi:hypothetical protein BBP40_007191 [Aspergillus hancockii]|nr:hypothetical protein BBP40_007191 [Aspergillus hancockii]
MSVATSPVSQKGYVDNNCLSQTTTSKGDSRRQSTVSAASIISNQGKRKTHVGPWQLGKNLGEGATGRVRLAKHAVTKQTAAIKIVSKKSAAMAQSDSIAAMDRNIGHLGGTGMRQMPCGIEREVVIMKLIEHPNVIRLYDVWENRGELYLVLEYVEGGELFNYVSKYGPLPELEAHNVKLADFGMAALQPNGHWLKTSCGSPHYAAPEIIQGDKYRGDKADLWSCGIILFALLTGYLPFDGGDLGSTLRLVKKGHFEIPRYLSNEAADLIFQILQPKPKDRISMEDIWLHPLMKKYEYLDPVMSNPFIGPAPPLSPHECGPPICSRQDIDLDLLRNLQTLWHDVKPEALIERLLSPRFRNEQLENYQSQALGYSASDYHHISKGPNWPSSQRNHVESYDPFRSPCHVVSKKEAEYAQITIHRAIPDTVPQKPETKVTEQSNAISEEGFEDEIECPPSSPFAIVRNKKKLSSVKSFQSRTSHAGSRRPPNGATTPRSISYKRNVCFRHVRNRSQGSSTAKVKVVTPNFDKETSENSLESIDVGPSTGRESSPLLPAQPAVVRGAGVAIKTCPQQRKLRDSDFIWKDDARQVSHELSQICEEAFNPGSLSTGCTTSTCMGSETPATSVSMASPAGSHSQITASNAKGPVTPSRSAGSPRSCTAAGLAKARRTIIANCTDNGSEDIPENVVPVIKYLDHFLEQDKLRQLERFDIDEGTRVLVEQSAKSSHEAGYRPKISEGRNAGSAVRHSHIQMYTGPVPQTTVGANSGRVSRDGMRTVRMVPQSSVESIDAVRPLTIRKKSRESSITHAQQPTNSQSGLDAETGASSRYSSLNSRHSRNPCELAPIAEVPPKSEKRYETRHSEHKKWSWLPLKSHVSTETAKKLSGDMKHLRPSNATVIVHEVKPPEDSSTFPQGEQEKSRQRGGFFRKFMKKRASKSSHNPIPDPQITEETIPILDPSTRRDSPADSNKPLPRRPRSQGKSVNWFARIFHFKPATRVIALNASKIKGRKEVYKILREWKPYGLESVYIDKANSVISGKVGEVNFLRLRPVEFSAEFYTVLEHGRQANLSLVRFRQERGAVSSFNKVVDTLNMVMKQRGLLVEDPSRARKMTRILDVHPDP